MTQLSSVLEVAVAVGDLIHIQESSVLVCLENGWDATAQVGVEREKEGEREGGRFWHW